MSRFKWLEISETEKKDIFEDIEQYDETYYLNLADEKFNQGLYESALRYYSRVLNLNLNSQKAWLGQLLCLVDLGEYSESLTWADKAMEIFPGDPEIIAIKALAYGRLGVLDKAIGFSDSSLKNGRNSYLIWWIRGDILISQDEKNAEYCFLKATELSKRDFNLMLMIGKTFLSIDKPIKAKKFITQAVNINPDHSLSWYWSGVVYQELGLYDQAKNALKRALELNPKNLEFISALDELQKKNFISKIICKFKRFLKGE
ncbi:MAG: tetratricopeptide repeat protein [Desulfobacterales bacterium]|nr:tetratricopeptide repeat protein [Desulfobacterales bacterium]MBF0397787.1 tetratricopeptide repeat protein [Desulfobacterales bacterium]